MNVENFLNHKAVEISKLSIRSTTKAGSGHPSSALSLAHLVSGLMYHHMRYDPKDPWNPCSDRLVLSEGHAVPIIYAAYCDLGGAYGKSREEAKHLTVEDLEALREIGSVLDGHPNPGIGFSFFDAATGSLGQGLSAAAGLALAARRDECDKRIYCLIGDGEAREGQVWEAVDFLVDYKLSAVTPIFNCNAIGQSDYVSQQQAAETVAKKLEAYGCNVLVIDGHHMGQVLDALGKVEDGKVTAIVAKTVKGWGTETLQGGGHHGKPLTDDETEQAYKHLDAKKAELPPLGSDGDAAPKAPAECKKAASRGSGASKLPPADFAAMLGDAKLEKKVTEKGVLATRNAYGVALRELGKVNPDVVALDGDVSNSTFSCWFAAEFPERYFEGRIAEQNIVSAAVGLAAGGKIPFLSSFAKFLTRGYDQIDLATIGGAPIKIVGSHAGSSLGADGPSQMSLSDIAYFRSMAYAEGQNGEPVCVTFNPSDAYCAYKAVELCANHPGMTYIRTARPDVPFIYDAETEFEIGGAHMVAEGDDVILVSSGYMLSFVHAILPELEKEGVKAGLVDAYSFPIRSEMVKSLAADKSKVIVTVEDNYAGGLASDLAEMSAAAQGARVMSVICARVPKSAATAEESFDYTRCGKKDIIETVKKAIG